MKSLLKMTWMEGKLFLREPVGVFFSLIFPLMMLLIFGTIYSSQGMPGSDSQAAINMLIPALIAMTIGITGLMPVTITMATYRENGILRRLSTTPVSPLVVIAAQVAVVFTMTSLGVLLLFTAGKYLYHASASGSSLSILGGFVLCSLSFFGIGFILAGVMPNARTAQIVGMVLMYPMVIFSGAGWPRELMPAAIQNLAAYIPLTYVVNLLRGLWSGEAWGAHLVDVGVLGAMLVVGVLVSARTFRWE